MQLLCYAKNFIDVEIIFRIAPLEADLLLWIPRETQAEGFLATSKRVKKSFHSPLVLCRGVSMTR